MSAAARPEEAPRPEEAVPSPGPLPSPAGFQRRIDAVTAAVTAGALGLVLLYLLALLRLPEAQWRAFFEATLVALLALGLAEKLRSRRETAPVRRYLELRESGPPGPGAARAADPSEAAAAAYRRVATLPQRAFPSGQLAWLVGSLAVVAGTALRAESLAPRSAAILVAAGVSAGFVCMVFHHFALRRVTTPVAAAIARELDDPERVERLTPFLGLKAKLLWAVTGVTAVVVLFAVLLAQDASQRSVESQAVALQRRYLEAVRPEVAAGGEAALAAAEARARRLGIAERIFVYAPASPDAEWPLEEDERLLLAEGGRSGRSSASGAAHAFAWLPLGEGGRRLVAASRWETVLGAVDDRGLAFAALALLAAGLAAALALVLAQEVARGTRALREESERIASGDLGHGAPFVGDDELGALGRTFGRMAAALRATVQGVARATEGVEGAAREMAGVSRAVSAVTADQRQGIELATHSVGSVDERIAGVTEGSEALRRSAEEASGAIVALSASGEQLHGTASVLSAKVDEVGGSIERMNESVERVVRRADDLSGAADETAGSVEEMATSMRQVDANAAETARLSSAVVEASERGRETVRLTIEGMEAIRGSTDAAERVIRTLGERSREIGAIVDVIDDVADETNLLALNAAVIAAQSGEHGRAFSVVADEIKELADRVLENTKEIASVVRGLQRESGNATQAIAEGAARVQSGTQLSAEAGRVLEEITGAARESGGRIQGIVAAVREQTEASAHVARLMERVRGGAEEIRRAGRQHGEGTRVVARNAEDMREVAQQVDATTREQARGSARIGRTVETVRETVGSIHASLEEQSRSCNEVADFLRRVDERTRANEESVSRMGEATRRLLEQAEVLRGSIRRFQV